MEPRTKIAVEALNLWYGEKQALFDVHLTLPENQVTAFIGPSGCGKTSLLKCLNRMHDETAGARVEGRVLMRALTGEMEDIGGAEIDPPFLRRRFGWVAQKPDPFPDSVYDNLAYPAHLHGMLRDGPEMDAHIERLLRRASLWEELKDRLREPGTDLSIGQQQRLCVARALSVAPEALLMDEPAGSLDPIATEHIEDLILELKGSVTIVLITHNMEQARRVADKVAFFHLGEMRESGPVDQIFDAPQDAELKAYLAGRFG